MNGVHMYKTNKYGLHSSFWVKTNGPSVTAIVLFCFGAAPLSKNIWAAKGAKREYKLKRVYKLQKVKHTLVMV